MKPARTASNRLSVSVEFERDVTADEVRRWLEMLGARRVLVYPPAGRETRR